jgi:glutathione peroxidase
MWPLAHYASPVIRSRAVGLTVLLAIFALGCARSERAPTPGPAAAAEPPAAPEKEANTMTADALYDISIQTLEGQPSSLAEHKGKALLLVNVASKCGMTPQYETLEKLQKRYEGKGFTVLGFPCNQFGGQEPGSPEEIQTFCATNYGISFPLFEKIEVNGAGRHPIYAHLTKVPDGSGEAGDVQWNFEKFVISADGERITRFRSKTVPDAPEVIAAIESGLPR